MSKSELLQQLETLSPGDLEEVAERVNQLRRAELTDKERVLIRDRVSQYRANPNDVVDLDEAVGEISSKRK